jgi:hypothetical protein
MVSYIYKLPVISFLFFNRTGQTGQLVDKINALIASSKIMACSGS